MVNLSRRQIGSLIAISSGLGLVAGGAIYQGTNPDHGKPGVGADDPNFQPPSICIVYIKFENQIIKSKQIYLYKKISANLDRDKRKSLAAEYIKKCIGAYGSVVTDGYATVKENFVDFDFVGPYEIYMFLDNSTDVVFDDYNLIKFTKYSAYRPPSGSPKPEMNKNKSFRGADIVPIQHDGSSFDVLYLQNHCKKYMFENIEFGESSISTNETLKYSMNIHLKMATSSAIYLPIIIDPNTSNTGGF